MKIARFVFILVVACLLSSTAVADVIEDDEFGFTVTAPDAWEVDTDDDKSVASFKHPGSQSQIQVIGTQLMNAEVSDVFFDTFHTTLSEQNFEVAEEEETTIGEIEGLFTTYEYTHNDVTLDVTVFEFLRDDTAWLAIGYMHDEQREEHQQDYESVVENLSFESE